MVKPVSEPTAPAEPTPTLEQIAQNYVDAKFEFNMAQLARLFGVAPHGAAAMEIAYRIAEKNFCKAKKRIEEAVDAA